MLLKPVRERRMDACPDVDVIIPTKDSFDSLREAISSVEAQTYPNIHTIVCDDHSDSCCRDRIQSLCDDDRIECHYLDKHRGVSAARNLGLSRAKSTYVLFLDDDDQIESGLIFNLVSSMRENSDAQAAFAPDSSKRRCGEVARPGCKVVPVSTPEERRRLYESRNQGKLHIYRWGSAWGKLFDRSFLIRNGITFKEEMTALEDSVFMCDFCSAAERVLLVDGADYKYSPRINGLSQKCGDIDRMRFDEAKLRCFAPVERIACG